MLYHHLFAANTTKQQVLAAVIGAGHFGTAVVTQQTHTPRLRIPIVADKIVENARQAFIKAGIAESDIVRCDSAAEARKHIADGRFVYTDNAMLIMEIPEIDVVCEGTGVPEASAALCLAAIEKGKHVAAISKEMDSVIGPLLKKIAKEHGVVYSPVDGDQPGLLMGLIEWARAIGLTVISGGKARDGEFVLDEATRRVSIAADGITVHEDAAITLNEADLSYFSMIPQGKTHEYVTRRAAALRALPGAGAFDLCELTIAANATGLAPACPDLTCASLRITELPIAYCAEANNGLYAAEGVIDVVTTLRRQDESGMGGGVYIVVRCDNAYSQYILTTKGQIPNHDMSTAVIYRPYHLCGVEVATTILSAGLLGIDTGSLAYLPRWDLVKRAACDIKAGETLGNDHDPRLIASIIPATIRGPEQAVPGHMITGNTTVRDIRAGETITYSMIADQSASVLWSLRLRQEREFAQM